MLDHQDKFMMKAQVHVSKSSEISDIQALPQRKQHCLIYQVVKHILRGRLLASFQDLKHEGGDTRSQGGIKDNDSKIKIQDHWCANDHSNEFPRIRLQVSKKSLSSFAEHVTEFPEQFHSYQQKHICLQEDREE
nr:hypothetical protein [Tanacetum cinerariifolium]